MSENETGSNLGSNSNTGNRQQPAYVHYFLEKAIAANIISVNLVI